MPLNKPHDLVSEMIARFRETGDPRTAELAIGELFKLSGFDIQQNVRLSGADGAFDIDVLASPKDGDSASAIGVEVKGTKRPLDVDTIHQVLNRFRNARIARAVIVSRSGFTTRASALANDDELGNLALLSAADLADWLHRQIHRDDSAYLQAPNIIRTCMRDLARAIARYPPELSTIPWLDLERVMREVFEGIGFATELTRPAKDGGFDLRLALTKSPYDVFLVEVKHWTAPNRPGSSVVRRFAEIVVSENAKSGLLLSTSGFTKAICRGLTKIEKQSVRLGDRHKITALCRTYYMIDAQIWSPATPLNEILFEYTE